MSRLRTHALALAIAFCVALGVAGLTTTPAHAAAIHQTTTVTETVLTQPTLIREWTVDSGFIYWHESCRPFLDETEAFLKRRAVNGLLIQTQFEIDDAEDCETLLHLGVDNSGVYFYNHAAGTIEAIYAHTPTAPPVELTTVGSRTAIGFGHGISTMFPHGDRVYWIEVDPQGEFVPDDIVLRSVAKIGGSVQTHIEYGGHFAGHGMAFTPGFIFWIDGDGLQRIPDTPCPGGCSKTTIHSIVMRRGRLKV
ncbi:MAG: hypothetical protein WDZ49_11635, partial [Litorilinea sp.]